jgi:hypothetical protein
MGGESEAQMNHVPFLKSVFPLVVGAVVAAGPVQAEGQPPSPRQQEQKAGPIRIVKTVQTLVVLPRPQAATQPGSEFDFLPSGEKPVRPLSF